MKSMMNHYYQNLEPRANFLKSVYDRLSLPKSIPRYLDVGCGYGENTKAMGAYADFIACVDVRKEDLQVTKTNLPHAYCTQASITNLPFENESFDVVSAFSVLEHVDELELGIREVARVLKKGGLFVGQIPNKNFYVELHTYLPFTQFIPGKLRYNSLRSMGYAHTDIIPSFLSIEKLKSTFEKAGFDVLIEPLVYPVELIPKQFKATYTLMHSLGLFKLVPFGYFFVCCEKS